jgi:hypothetical protein
MVNKWFVIISFLQIYKRVQPIKNRLRPYSCPKKKPTTGIEPVNLILTKDVLYQLSYMGTQDKRAMRLELTTATLEGWSSTN